MSIILQQGKYEINCIKVVPLPGLREQNFNEITA